MLPVIKEAVGDRMTVMLDSVSGGAPTS